MREIIYFSSKARTSGNWKDLMSAGRMDIVCHVIINAFFISHLMRDDVLLHLVFYGQPTPPRHIEITKKEKYMPETGKRVGSFDISKKDVSGLIKRILFKYQEGRKTEVFPGCFIEKKNLFQVIDDLKRQGKTICILDKGGEDIRDVKFTGDEVFLLGDQEGIPKKEFKRIRKDAKTISLGKRTYFASQVVTILNNELDRKT
jgi:tRNA (pseudouridine54-N1)-methyltransferase